MSDTSSSSSDTDYSPTTEEMNDPNSTIMLLYTKEVIRRLKDPACLAEMKAADFEHLRKLCQDNSMTLASVKRGDAGSFAKKVLDEAYPFPGDEAEDGAPVFQ